MAVLVNFLVKDELIFECRTRGHLPGNLDKVTDLRDQLHSLLGREEKGEELESQFEFDLAEELLICQTKVSKIEAQVKSLTGDSTELPDKLVALMNHVSYRLAFHLGNCAKGSERNSLKKLALTIVAIREQLSSKLEKTKDILKKIPTFSEISSATKSDDQETEGTKVSKPDGSLGVIVEEATGTSGQDNDRTSGERVVNQRRLGQNAVISMNKTLQIREQISQMEATLGGLKQKLSELSVSDVGVRSQEETLGLVENRASQAGPREANLPRGSETTERYRLEEGLRGINSENRTEFGSRERSTHDENLYSQSSQRNDTSNQVPRPLGGVQNRVRFEGSSNTAGENSRELEGARTNELGRRSTVFSQAVDWANSMRRSNAQVETDFSQSTSRENSRQNFASGDHSDLRSQGYGDSERSRLGERGYDGGRRTNYVPLYKWDLSFSGSGVLNANQFLERVEELAETRRVSKGELFEGILELLSGDALLWYRVRKSHMRNWDEFKRELKAEFLPLAYEEALWKEIRNRKQGSGEKISSYIHCMLSLIGRLRENVTESRKLELILQNLSPDFALHFRVARPRSVDELHLLGRELERGMNCIEDYRGSKPLTFKNAVEKDCVFDQRKSRAEFHEIRIIECFNCGGDHFLRNCTEPRKLKCFDCGKPGVTRRECGCGGKKITKNDQRN